MSKQVLSFLFVSLLGLGHAAAATYRVTTVVDGDDGYCTVSHCTLREAIRAANATAAADTINFDGLGSGTVTLRIATPLPRVSQPLTLNRGTPASVTLVSTASSPILDFAATNAAITAGIIFADSAYALAVRSGNLVVSGASFTRNSRRAVTVAAGAGFTCDSCAFEMNGASVGAEVFGGAVFAALDARVSLSWSRFRMNRATSSGGAVFAERAMLSIDHCSFDSNRADAFASDEGGGAIAVRGPSSSGSEVTISTSAFHANGAAGNGGGINVQLGAPLRVNDSTFEENHADLSGGAIALDASTEMGAITLSSSVFLGNRAAAPGGAVSNAGMSAVTATDCAFRNNKSDAEGGAVSAGAEPAEFVRCEFGNNTAAGNGGALIGDITVTTSTLYGNTSETGSGAAVYGNPSIWLKHVTIVGNRALTTGAALDGSDASIKNSILSDNNNATGNASCGPALYVKSSANVASDTTCSLGATSRSGVDPRLGALGYAGSSLTRMYKLRADSPAIDFAASWPGITSDQRLRPFVGTPDAGAYEFAGHALIQWDSSASVMIPEGSAHSIGVRNDGAQLAATVNVSLVAATATAGIDYTGAGGDLDVLAGAWQPNRAAFTVTSDAIVDPSETFLVALSLPEDSPADLGPLSEVVVVIP